MSNPDKEPQFTAKKHPQQQKSANDNYDVGAFS